MKVAQVMGGFTLGEADILRRAMGKKKEDQMAEMKVRFLAGAKERGVDEKTADKVFEKMAYFAGYGFNKSHSAAYSVVAYHTAYFKANYTASYMAAVLTHNMNDIGKVSQFIEECYHLGVPVDAPNVNSGEAFFTAKEGRVQYGLSAIKGVGSSAVEHFVAERHENGLFTSIFDFSTRVDLRTCNRKMLESLIGAGAFDELHGNRAQLLESLDDVLSYGARMQEEKSRNQTSLFGGGDDQSSRMASEPKLREVTPWSNIEKLKRERELIGFFLSGHPLDRFRDDVALFCSHGLGEEGLNGLEERMSVTCAGIITAARHTRDRKGRPIAFLTMEDDRGSNEVLVFSECYDKSMNLLQVDNVVVVEGNVTVRDGTPKIIARQFDRIENLREKHQAAIRLCLNINTEEFETDKLEELADLFSENRGKTLIQMMVRSKDEKPIRMKVRKFVVDPSDMLLKETRRLIGKHNVWLEKRPDGE